jgi:hypothetical protein
MRVRVILLHVLQFRGDFCANLHRIALRAAFSG